VRFQVLAAANVKFVAFWDIVPSSFVTEDRSFISLMLEAVRTSETSVYFSETHGIISQKAATFFSQLIFETTATDLSEIWHLGSVLNIF
jgi:hypothetical protein